LLERQLVTLEQLAGGSAHPRDHAGRRSPPLVFNSRSLTRQIA
jgi:hypothetical protein